MSGIEDGLHTAENAWEEERTKDLHDRRVAQVSVNVARAREALDDVETWINAEVHFIGYSAHPHSREDAHTAKKIVKRLRKSISEVTLPTAEITISGNEILAMEGFVVEPSEKAERPEQELLSRIPTAQFFETLSNAYISNPRKTDPPRRFEFVRKMFQKSSQGK